ncbi:ketosteroid isomerase-like protein [Streptacidiphilus sp. MAP12-16]|uniref:nuclear transport factor 2 family protein n=1 Tax=Streptacidiphilus sp. MAP12-16 TaxID=3156300 RepID=UPI00351811CA
MNTTELSENAVRAYIDAIGAGKTDVIQDMLAEDATWTLIGSLPMTGTWQGRAAIFEDFLGLAFGRIDAATLELSTTSLLASGGKVAAEWTSRTEVRGGGQYDQECVGIFTVRDGLIVSVREYVDTDHTRTALFRSWRTDPAG